MIDISFLNNNDLSIGKLLLIFYIFASSNALFPLLSKQLKPLLENNRMAQHILAFSVILSIILLFSNGKYSFYRIISYAAICYLWFIMSTKVDIHFTIITIFSLIGLLFYQNQIQDEEDKIMNDPNVTEIIKQQFKTNKYYNYLYITGAIISFSILGSILYSNKKTIQYGGGYNLFNFLFY